MSAAVVAGEHSPQCAAAPAQAVAPAAGTAASAQAPVRVPAEASQRLVLNMTGSKASTETKDWAAFKQEWRAIFQEQATAAGLKFEYQDGAEAALIKRV